MGFTCWLTWHQTDTSWRNKWLERDASDLSAMLANAKQNAATEHDWQRKFATAQQNYQDNLQAANDEADRALTDYRNGTKRLRASLNCAAANLPDPATASGVRDAAAKCGLQQRDVEFLILFAKRAEAVRQQLIHAQAILKAIYSNPPQ